MTDDELEKLQNKLTAKLRATFDEMEKQAMVQTSTIDPGGADIPATPYTLTLDEVRKMHAINARSERLSRSVPYIDPKRVIGDDIYHEILNAMHQATHRTEWMLPGTNTQQVRVDTSKLLDAIIVLVAHIMETAISPNHHSFFKQSITDLIHDAIAARRRKYLHVAVDSPIEVPVHAPILEVLGPDKVRIRLVFTPEETITALELHRCTEMLDGYIPLKMRLRALVEHDLLKHFTEASA